jgi:hypothetical protein
MSGRPLISNPVYGVVVSVVALSMVDRGLESPLGQTKEYQLGICCFFDRHEGVTSKDWLVENQDNMLRVDQYVYQRTVVSLRDKNQIKPVGLVQRKYFHHLIVVGLTSTYMYAITTKHKVV